GFFVSGGVDRTVRLWKVPAADTVQKERKRGQIKFVNRQVDAGSQTLNVYAEVENADGVLIPGTFATVIVYPTSVER
ncbi:MAG: hypothetical protein ACRDD1_01585, partial [Planctomycetia bacterium]